MPKESKRAGPCTSTYLETSVWEVGNFTCDASSATTVSIRVNALFISIDCLDVELACLSCEQRKCKA